MPATIVALQETAMTMTMQHEMTEFLRVHGSWRPFWGHPRPGVTGSLVHGLRGGVGFLIRLKTPAIRVSLPDDLSHYDLEGRLLHVKVAIGDGKQFFHVLSVYAPSGEKNRRSGKTFVAREQLLYDVLHV